MRASPPALPDCGRDGTEAKASAAGPLIAMETGRGEPVWTPRDYATFAREGVMQNAIVYRAVRMIAESAASVPLLLYERDAEIVEHPLLDLLRRPSPGMTGTDLLESFYGFLLVAGNAYIEAASARRAIARTARAAARSDEGDPRRGRLAGGVRVLRRRRQRADRRRAGRRACAPCCT